MVCRAVSSVMVSWRLFRTKSQARHDVMCGRLRHGVVWRLFRTASQAAAEARDDTAASADEKKASAAAAAATLARTSGCGGRGDDDEDAVEMVEVRTDVSHTELVS